jgi:hypothetical protein
VIKVTEPSGEMRKIHRAMEVAPPKSILSVEESPSKT